MKSESSPPAEQLLPSGYVNSLGMPFVESGTPGVLFSIWPTRVRDFRAFVEATSHDACGEMYSADVEGWEKKDETWLNPGFKQDDDHPVVGVSWEDAKAFCAWLTKAERDTRKISATAEYRLPTDEEWSRAIGLANEPGDTPEEKSGAREGYPWGTGWPPPKGAGNYAGEEVRDGRWPKNCPVIEGYSSGFTRTSPVGSFPPSPHGLFDLSGNVWEWCEDWLDPADPEFRVSRGASWFSGDRSSLMSSCRGGDHPGDRADYLGFRCVLRGKKRDRSNFGHPAYSTRVKLEGIAPRRRAYDDGGAQDHTKTVSPWHAKNRIPDPSPFR